MKILTVALALIVGLFLAPSAAGLERTGFGAVFMTDWLTWTAIDDGLPEHVGDMNDGSEFRMVRLSATRPLGEGNEVRLSFDLKGGQAIVRDAYMELTNMPYVGDIRLGHFREPFSIEAETSSRFVSFMEFGLPTVFSPGRNMGLMLKNRGLGRRAQWAVGVFQEVSEYGNSLGVGKVSLTGRVVALPMMEDESGDFIHAGLAFSTRAPHGERVRYRARPELSLAPWFVDTRDPVTLEDIRAERLNLGNAEVAGSFGPLHFQGVYTRACATLLEGEDPPCESCGSDNLAMWGLSAQAGYFITGEHRSYSFESGSFSPVVPSTDFLEHDGSGAWEVVARYSVLDLTQADTVDSMLSCLSLGVNWYPSVQTRLLLNVVTPSLEDIGSSLAVAMRLQANF
ncbi:MAG: porin [Gemmatimonadota bacterium]